MAGAEPRVRGLRPNDPRELGIYQIVGRLGEGGMGSVFLANAPDGRSVALKVIRAELADDAQFRRRFRGEVARARQVPPFCTAEVLDADTEHDPPYLVVEYVDGPSLSEVVQERGPLSPANQHGIALGVAVALTAIHGAGVIHRDLKPSNVLLAPGSPKVIDFGIARAAAGSQVDTSTGQVVGSVAYMAPEQFEPDASRSLTPAADVFAWGGIVAYAATGRTPFAADAPAAVAIRIMTQPPDLDGLSGPLRDLVESSLRKDPADRPTARELVDRLLTGGGTVAARPAAFAEQPEVLAAAGIAPAKPGPVAAPPTFAPTTPVPHPPVPHSPVIPGPMRSATVPASALSARAPVPTGSTVYLPQPRRGGGVRVAIVALTLAVLLLGGAVAAIWTGQLGNSAAGLSPSSAGPLAGASATDSASAPGPTATPGPSVTVGASPNANAVASIDPAAAVLVKDSLARWTSREDVDNDATCEVSDTLTVTLRSRTARSYRCPGINDSLTDFTVFADVTLADDNSCAGVWFRYTDDAGGYALMVCADRYELVSHVRSKATHLLTLFADSLPVPAGQKIRVGIRAKGNQFWFFRDDQVSPQISDGNRFPAGRVVLGVFPASDSAEPAYRATFSNVEVWRVAAG